MEKICKYCKWFETNESWCRHTRETKSQKSRCDDFAKSILADIR